MRQATRERQATLAKPVGALGRLEDLSLWISAVQRASPPRPFARPRVVVFAGDHGVARSGVSAYPSEVTPLMVQAFLSGVAGVNALARLAGATVRVLDLSVDADLTGPGVPEDVTSHKVRRGSGSIDVEDAMTLEEASTALRAGMAIADEEVDSGADLLIAGDMGIGNTTPAAALVGTLTGANAAEVVGRGTGIDDRGWMRKCAAVRDAMRRGRPVLGDHVALLSRIGGADLAAMTGFLLQAAVRRTPVVLDGVISCACAVVAHDVAPRASLWWIAGSRSTEPAQKLALDRLALEPVVDMGLRLGEGTGALLALPLLQAAAATCAEMATLEELGGSH
ncbi:nicotinate-nucleotide--dimethylbenzimidazole phosphoribosyltransferase [Motilibacter peucedani]